MFGCFWAPGLCFWASGSGFFFKGLGLGSRMWAFLLRARVWGVKVVVQSLREVLGFRASISHGGPRQKCSYSSSVHAGPFDQLHPS